MEVQEGEWGIMSFHVCLSKLPTMPARAMTPNDPSLHTRRNALLPLRPCWIVRPPLPTPPSSPGHPCQPSGHPFNDVQPGRIATAHVPHVVVGQGGKFAQRPLTRARAGVTGVDALIGKRRLWFPCVVHMDLMGNLWMAGTLSSSTAHRLRLPSAVMPSSPG